MRILSGGDVDALCTYVSHTAGYLVISLEMSLHAGTGVELAPQHQRQSGCHKVGEIIQSRGGREDGGGSHSKVEAGLLEQSSPATACDLRSSNH